MDDATGLAEALLGLDGFRVMAVQETAAEVVIRVETIRRLVGCPGCGVQATAHDRMAVEFRDLPVFGRPARIVWHKRRWRCEEPLCERRTWTETSPAFSSRCLPTNRAGWEACRQVGMNARSVSQLAREMGVCWDTIMEAVTEHGQPLIDDPARVGEVRMLGVDETAFLRANAFHPTVYATGIVDLDERIMIDVVSGNTSIDLGSWLDEQPPEWLGSSRPIWPSHTVKRWRADSATRSGSPTRFMWSESPTVASIRCADASRTRRRGTAAASATRFIASASSC